jgi:hypothetical protein
MSFIRVLERPSRCMQRLGYIKYVLSRGAATSTTSLEKLGHELVDTVRRRVSVPLTPALYTYAKRRLTDRTYASLKQELERLGPDFAGEQALRVEIQDAYLADPALPSRTGKLVNADWRKYPNLLTGLGLLRESTYSLMVMGQTLLCLTPEKEIKAFRDYAPQTNPFRLSDPQQLLFLFMILDKDGDVLHPLYRALLEGDGVFNDRGAGDLLPAIFRDIEKRCRDRTRSGNDLQRLQQLRETADTVERWASRQQYTGKGAREETITPRLEPFADLGLLDKEDSFGYYYTLSKAGRAFWSAFCRIELEDIEDFLNGRFFEAAAEAYGYLTTAVEGEELLARLYAAYNEIKSPLGYAPIKEVGLLAGVRALAEEGLCFELADALALLKEVQRAQPRNVRFNIDRMGRLTYVKFQASPLEEA